MARTLADLIRETKEEPEAVEPMGGDSDSDDDGPGFIESVRQSAEDFARGAAEGSSFGFSGELANAVGSLQGAASDTPRAAGRGVSAPLMTMAQRADVAGQEAEAESEGALARARERSPVLTTTGEVMGAVGSSGVPGGAVAKLAGRVAPGAVAAVRASKPLQRVASVAESASVGGLESAGRDQDVTRGLQIGMAAPAVVGAAKSAARTLAAKSAPRLESAAARHTLAAGGAEKGLVKRLAKTKGRDAPVKYAEDFKRLEIGTRRDASGAVREGRFFGSTVEDFAEDAQSVLERESARADSISGQMARAGASVPGHEVADMIDRQLVSKYRDIPGAEESLARARKIADSFRASPSASWDMVQRARRWWGAKANWNSQNLTSEFGQEMYGILRKAQERAAESLDMGLAREWSQATRNEHTALQALEFADNALAKDANRVISPSDYAAAATGAVLAPGGVTSAAAGAGTGMLNRIVRGREHSVAAETMGGLAKFGRSAQAAGTPVVNTPNLAAVAGMAAASESKKRAPEAPKRHMPRMLRESPKGAPREGSRVSQLIREAMKEDMTQAAVEHYVGSVTDDAHREGAQYNPK